MAFSSSTLTKIPARAATDKLAIILAKPADCTPKLVFFHASPRPPCSFQASRRSYGVMATYDEAAKQAGRDVAKKGADAAVRGGQQLKKGATSAADNASQAMEDVTGNASVNAKLEAEGKMKQTAQDAAGKVMKTAEGAWGSVKDATQQIKDKVVGNAEAGAETVKKEAARVDRAMNTKNIV